MNVSAVVEVIVVDTISFDEARVLLVLKKLELKDSVEEAELLLLTEEDAGEMSVVIVVVGKSSVLVDGLNEVVFENAWRAKFALLRTTLASETPRRQPPTTTRVVSRMVVGATMNETKEI